MNEVTHPDWDAGFFRDVLDLADMAVLAINHDYEVIYANHYICERILGIPQSMAIGMSLPREKTLPDEEMQRVVEHTRRVLELGVAERIENWALHQDGSRRMMYWSSVPKLDESGKVKYLMAVGMDVTDQRREKQQLENLAHRDALTDLHNRAFFEQRLPQEVARANLEGIGLALLYIDLDGFKPVNDLHGHESGDAVLREVALRLRKGLRQNDTVCRIGGDEFAVILPGVAAQDDAGRIAEQMISRLSLPYDIDGRVHDIGASIGIAFLERDARDAPDLVKKADAAMYCAKRSGKGRFCFSD